MTNSEGPVRKMWQPMKITYVGDIADLVAVGAGKLSPTGGDPGEPRKQRPTG